MTIVNPFKYPTFPNLGRRREVDAMVSDIPRLFL
jgi:hypothetical protein